MGKSEGPGRVGGNRETVNEECVVQQVMALPAAALTGSSEGAHPGRGSWYRRPSCPRHRPLPLHPWGQEFPAPLAYSVGQGKLSGKGRPLVLGSGQCGLTGEGSTVSTPRGERPLPPPPPSHRHCADGAPAPGPA